MNHRILFTSCVFLLGGLVAHAQDVGGTGTTTSGGTSTGSTSGGGTVNTSGMSGGGFGGGLTGGSGTGTGDSFLGTAPGGAFLTSGYEPGTLGHAGRAGAATATNTGSPFGRFYVNAYALGITTTNNNRPAAFGTPLYSALYPGTQVATGVGQTGTGLGAGGRGGATGVGGVGGVSGVGGVGGVSPGITGAIGTGRTTGGVGGLGSTFGGGLGGVGAAGGFRPPAAYQTFIAFRYNRPTPSQRQLDLQQVLARSSELGPKNIQVDMDGNVVILRGVVAAPEERRLAENLIRLTPGVRQVRNELAVAP